MDILVTMPLSAITAISVVPPPMSTTMLPVGVSTGSPTPIAAAMGSGTSSTSRAPARTAEVDHRALLDFGDARRHADDDARADEELVLLHAMDELAQQVLGNLEVGDDAVARVGAPR